MVAEGGPEDEATADRPEEDEAFGVEPAFTHNEKDFSPITYKSNMYMYRYICRFLKEFGALVRVALSAEALGANSLLSV